MPVRKQARPPKISKQSRSKTQLGLPFQDMMRLHTEVPRDLKNRVDRVSLERRQIGLAQHTLSDLVAEALWEWLIGQGYAKKSDRPQ